MRIPIVMEARSQVNSLTDNGSVAPRIVLRVLPLSVLASDETWNCFDVKAIIAVNPLFD